MAALKQRLLHITRPIVDRCDPSLLCARHWRSSASRPMAIGIVYRARNAATVQQLLAAHPSARAALWALDQTHPSLQRLTIGQGPGTRFALHNRLTSALAPQPEEWLVLADDDVIFRCGDLNLTASVAQRLGLNLVQPAHADGSHISWPDTRRRLGRIARETRWVEIGPLVLFDHSARGTVMPFPEIGMGWGVDAEWGAHQHLRLGMIDAAQMLHLVPAHGSYDTSEEQKHLEERYRALGVTEQQVSQWRLPMREWFFWSRP